MSDFYKAMSNTVSNVSVTENGMVGYKTTNHELLDFNFKVSSYRGNATQGVKDFMKVLAANETYALKYLFYLRDAREGIGERDLFKACLHAFAITPFIANRDEVMKVVIEQTPEYGRFDDLFALFDTSYEQDVYTFAKKQLAEDFENYKAGKSISLLAKWMPSVNASKATRKIALKFIKAFGTSEKEYRKTLSALRAYLDVVEVKACDKRWNDIDYNAVPSKANLKYKDAFLRNDETRRREYLAKLVVGDKSVKINSSVNFPHEIVSKYRSDRGYWGRVNDYDEALEQLWKALKPCVGLKDTIVVRDGSGSMTSSVGGTNTTALDVSTALAVYCSQYTQAGFKDKFITFSSEAKLVDLSNRTSLHSKLERCYSESDCSNTDLENVFDLILKTALDNNMVQSELPSTVLVISDMEFDPGHGSGWGYGGMNFDSNVISKVSAKFAQHGYKLPKLAFWNVNSRTGTIPVKQNENGVTLISGFSQNVLSMVMNGETDPYKALIKELDKVRYSVVPMVGYVEETKVSPAPTMKETRTRKTVTVKETPAFLK